MQPKDGSSPGGRAALLRLSTDLKLHPVIVAAALEYAFEHQHAFPDAGQALCFGIVRQGHSANMEMLELPLQRLHKDFGGIFGAPAVQRTSSAQWLAQPSIQSRAQLRRRIQAVPTTVNTTGRPAGSFTPSAALIALWPTPQRRGSNVFPKTPGSSASAHSGEDEDLSAMLEDAKFAQR